MGFAPLLLSLWPVLLSASLREGLQCQQPVVSSTEQSSPSLLWATSRLIGTSLLPAPPAYNSFSAGSVFSFIDHMVLLLLSSHGDKFGPPLVPELLHILLGSPWCGVYDSTHAFRAEPFTGDGQDTGRVGRRLFQGLRTYCGLIPLYWLFQFLWYLIRDLGHCFPESPGSWRHRIIQEACLGFLYSCASCLPVSGDRILGP